MNNLTYQKMILNEFLIFHEDVKIKENIQKFVKKILSNKNTYLKLNLNRLKYIDKLVDVLKSQNIETKLFIDNLNNQIKADIELIKEDRTNIKKIFRDSLSSSDSEIRKIMSKTSGIKKEFLPAIPIILKLLYILVYIIPFFGRIILSILSVFAPILLPLLTVFIGIMCLLFIPLFNQIKDMMSNESKFEIFIFFAKFNLTTYIKETINFYKTELTRIFGETINIAYNTFYILEDLFKLLVDNLDKLEGIIL